VLVQALDDDLDKLGLKDRRDAFCGKLSVCNNLYQYGIPFTNTSLHTSAIASDVFERDLDYFSRVCRTVKGLRTARIGQIGTRPAAFQTVRFSEKLLQRSGITVVPIDMSEMIARASKFDPNAPEVKSKLLAIRGYGHIADEIKEEGVIRQAQLSVALDQWMEETQCDAGAIQCWDSVQANFGCATCLSMSMMGERFLPSACETDIAGAVSMYALLLASGNPPGFQDWNNNYGDDRDKCINVHCSNYPKSFMGREVEISNLDILGESLGYDRCFGAVKGQVAPGSMTFFRMSTFDAEGGIRAYVGEGEFTDDPCAIQGGSAVCRVVGLQKLMNYLCKNGFEHHVALTRGTWANVIEEALTTYLKCDLYVHKP
jgi:L-fucose isomerase-like protein